MNIKVVNQPNGYHTIIGTEKVRMVGSLDEEDMIMVCSVYNVSYEYIEKTKEWITNTNFAHHNNVIAFESMKYDIVERE